jgi:hypothetical protein
MKNIFLLFALASAATLAQTPQYLPKSGGTMTGPFNAPSVNGISNVLLYAGATADVQINACLAANAVCDARGYGATTQSIAATVEVGAGGAFKTLLVSPSTQFSPASTGVTMFKVDRNGVLRDLHISISNSFTGKAMDVEDTITTNNVQAFSIDGLSIDAGTYATGGYGLYLAPPSGSYIQLTNFSNVHVNGLRYSMYIKVAGTNTYFNGNNFSNLVLEGNGTALTIDNAGLQVMANHFTNLQTDGSGCALSYVGTSPTTGNFFSGHLWDTTTPICNTSTNAIQNVFTGAMDFPYTDSKSLSAQYPSQNIYNLVGGVTNYVEAPTVGAVNEAATGDAVVWIWQRGTGHQWQLISSTTGGTCVANGACLYDGSVPRFVWASNSSGLFGVGNHSDPSTDPLQADSAGNLKLNSVYGNSTASFTPGGAATVGTGATVACAAGAACDQLSGTVQLNTGTGTLSPGTVLTIALGTTRTYLANCVVQVRNDSTGGPILVYNASSTTGITINSSSAWTASNQYTIVYLCGGK